MPSRLQEKTPVPVLAAAAAVCRSHPDLDVLPHVAQSISVFADSSCELWTLESLRGHWTYLNVHHKQLKMDEASAVRLQDRLLAREWSGLTEAFRLGRFRYGLKFVGYNMPLLDAWLTKYLPFNPDNAQLLLESAIKHNRIKVLEWLEQHSLLLPSQKSVALHCDRAAAAYWLAQRGFRLSVSVYDELSDNDLEFIKWAHEHKHTLRDVSEGIVIAMSLNNLEMAQWLLETFPDMDWDEPTEDFLPNHDLAMATWVVEHFPWAPEPESVDDEDDFDEDYPYKLWVQRTVAVAAREGDLDVVKYLYDHPLNDPCCQIMFDAARGGHIEIVQWLYDHQPECAEAALGYAVTDGHLELVQWLHSQLNQLNRQDTRPSILQTRVQSHDHAKQSLIDMAASKNHFNLIKWLHENRTDEFAVRAIDTAARHGRLDILQWLHVNRDEGCSEQALLGALCNGHLEVVQWLLANRNECKKAVSSKAMDEAACHGHLHIVKWLHEHRSEGCTVNAVNQAAANGHFEVVKFLLENRSEGCITNAVDLAAANGHLDIVKFIVSSGVLTSMTSSSIDHAAAYGQYDVLRWLYNNSAERCTARAIDMATRSGHAQVVKFLYQHCNFKCSEDAITFAAEYNHFALLEWVLQHDPAFANFKYKQPTLIFHSQIS